MLFDPERRAELLKEAWIEHDTQAGWLFLHQEIQMAVYSNKTVRWSADAGADRLPFAPAEWKFEVLKT